MRIRAPEHQVGGDLINLSPLIDVMFILIIFFLATTTFEEEERDVEINLPDAAANAALTAAPKVDVINVRADGSYLLGSAEMTLDQLRDALNAAAAKPDQKVLIRGDENARHGAVAAAVLACKAAGIHEANIGYELPR